MINQFEMAQIGHIEDGVKVAKKAVTKMPEHRQIRTSVIDL